MMHDVASARRGWVLLALLTLTASKTWAQSPATGAKGSVVAVFALQTSRVSLRSSLKQTLWSYLTASIAASDHFRVVPQETVKRQIRKAKKASYRQCYSQRCQVAIGRELAASLVFSPKIVKTGKQCRASLLVYRLASATADEAYLATGACDEEGLTASLAAVVKQLTTAWTTRALAAHRAGAVATTRPQQRKNVVTLNLSSKPRGARVLLDGQPRGETPLSMQLSPNKPYLLRLERHDHRPYEKRVVLVRDQSINVRLRLVKAAKIARMTSTEWFGIGIGMGFNTRSNNNETGILVGLRLMTLKYQRFFWRVLEGSATFVPSKDPSSAGADDGRESSRVFNVFSRAGYPLYFGQDGGTQLLFGLGVGASFIQPAGNASGVAFGLWPSATLVTQTSGSLDFGLSVGVVIPLVDSFDSSSKAPFQVMLSVTLGWAPGRGSGRWSVSRQQQIRRPGSQ